MNASTVFFKIFFYVLWVMFLTSMVNSASLISMMETPVKNESGKILSLDHRNNNNSDEGHWFNQGLKYPDCDNVDDEELCKDYQFNKNIREQVLPWQLDYNVLTKRIVCTLRKINCPTKKKSFQVSYCQ